MSENKRSVEFLNKVYQNAGMAAESITYITDKVTDNDLLSDLQSQHQQYSMICNRATQALSDEDALPKDNSAMSKIGVWTGTQMNTMFDRTPDKIAELMIQGSIMGVIDMSRVLKQYSDVPPNIRDIGTQLIQIEENSAQRMKTYLG